MGWFVGNGWRGRCLFYVNTATGEKSGEMLALAKFAASNGESD